MYEVILATEAQKIYLSANQSLAKKIVRCFEQLEKTPRFHPNIRPLKGKLTGCYRYRIGDYRVIYQVNDEINQVQIIAIAHRREVYD